MSTALDTGAEANGRLSVSDLVVEYSSGGYVVRPINGLSLEVRPGQLVLLLGASGSGKTTLLSVLAAILTPAAGSVQLGHTDVLSLRGDALTHYRRHQVGIVFQAFNLISSLNAWENVQVPMRSAGRTPGEAKERAAALLERVGLSERMKHRPGDLSGGEQQRVAIARALASDPPLILADEPTAHLDFIQVEGVLKLLREIGDSGRMVVVATHDERMIPLADYVVSLSPRTLGESREPERVDLSPGQRLFRQGDVGELIYVVEEGEIEIVRERDDGTEELLTFVLPGQYFGELAPIFGLRRSATARAAGTPTRLNGYTVRDFRRIVHPEALAKLLKHAAD
jgi:putative ABC transport system ATP-binding protein